MRKLLLTAAIIALAGMAQANPRVSEKTKYYKINGDSVKALKADMRKRGPNGFWAYTRWYVKWTGSCKVTVTVDYTMPKLANPNAVPKEVKAKFDRMYAKLWAHEKNHGQHGIDAGREIAKKKCQGGDGIIKKHAKRDKVYDKKTKHGLTEGVKF